MLALLLAACGPVATPASHAADLPAPGAFPHAMFTEILAKHVDAQGLVDYKSIQQDRAPLDAYTAVVALASPRNHPEIFPTADDQLSYYINAYNAYAITGVIDRPGLKSVQDELVRFFYGTKYKLGGKKTSLYDLENKIVRPTFEDPRVHFALNCDSGGCPRLPAEAFDPARLQEQLDAAAREFVTNPAKVKVEGDKVMISQIFEWYKDDFEASGGALKFINAHGGNVPEGGTLSYIPYDWSLIAQPGRGP